MSAEDLSRETFQEFVEKNVFLCSVPANLNAITNPVARDRIKSFLKVTVKVDNKYVLRFVPTLHQRNQAILFVPYMSACLSDLAQFFVYRCRCFLVVDRRQVSSFQACPDCSPGRNLRNVIEPIEDSVGQDSERMSCVEQVNK